MAKRVSSCPESLHAEGVVDLYSVSGCISRKCADYIKYWKHNGYWFFDSPEIIRKLAQEQSIDMHGTSLFYYDVHEHEFDDAINEWSPFGTEPSFTTQVIMPAVKVLEGYDVVGFKFGTGAECSPLSCNYLATEIKTNQHCLLDSLGQAQTLLESGKFKHGEGGPYRIFAVYSADAPGV